MFNKDFKQFLNLNAEQKLVLLKALDFDVDSRGFIVESANKKVICPYSKMPVKLENASILPGSTIIINTSLITLSEYISEYLESEEDLTDGSVSG